MSIKMRDKNGQIDRYEFFPGGAHTHEWNDRKTGMIGYHGENASADLKKWTGDSARASTHGERTRGVKGPK